MRLAPTQRNAFQNYLLALNSILPGEEPEVSICTAMCGAKVPHECPIIISPVNVRMNYVIYGSK